MINKTILPTFDAISAGSAATVQLPRGRRYRAIHLELGDGGLSSVGNEADIEATLAALIGNVVVKTDGHAQRTFTGVQLSQYNGANGVRWSAKGRGTPGTAAYRVQLSIYFAEPWRKNLAEGDILAWNIDNALKSFTIDVNFLSTVVTPTVTGYYEWEFLGDRKFGPIVKMFQQSYGASGTTQDHSLPVKSGFLQSIHLFPTSAGQFIDKVKLTVDGTEVQDLITNAQNAYVLQTHEMDPDTGDRPRFDLVLDHADRVDDAINLDAVTNIAMQVQYNAAASGTFAALVVVGGKPE